MKKTAACLSLILLLLLGYSLGKKNYKTWGNDGQKHSKEVEDFVLKTYPVMELSSDAKADLVVFSFDRPLQLYAFLESFHQYASNAGERTVIYRTTDQEYQDAYDEVVSSFPEVTFIKQGDNPHADFKSLVLGAALGGSADYIVFAVDDIIVKAPVDFQECISAMEVTRAYGFFLRLGKQVNYSYMLDADMKIPQSALVKEGIYAWQFSYGEADWNYPNTVDMTVYKKSDILADLVSMEYVHPNSFEGAWANRRDSKKVGLYFENSKIVNIPLNLVNLSENRNMHSYSAKELLIKFKEGLKMDISPLAGINNRSPHIDYDPQFIGRNPSSNSPIASGK